MAQLLVHIRGSVTELQRTRPPYTMLNHIVHDQQSLHSRDEGGAGDIKGASSDVWALIEIPPAFV